MVLIGCGSSDDLPVLTVDMPLHLEDHLADARVTGSVAPSDGPQAMEWRFDEPQPEWRVARMPNPVSDLATVEATGDALRLTLTDAARRSDGMPVGSVAVDVPPTTGDAWGDVVVRLRSDSTVNTIYLRVNPGGENAAGGQGVPVVRDGTIQTYLLPWPTGEAAPVRAWIAAGRPVQSFGLAFQAPEGPGSVDILSVSVPPIGDQYRAPALGASHVARAGRGRRALYVHAPSRLEFRVTIPEGGRLDYGARGLRAEAPITFRVAVDSDQSVRATLAVDTVSDASEWRSRTVDLSAFAGETVTLVLENESTGSGGIAFWSAPTVTGSGPASKPNVILYVIDGGGADQMSLYGYNRRTTPNLDAIASEGAVFEWAHSSASWTPPSTTSFMSSLHNSVLGNTGRFGELPPNARTMAERFHDAGYQTAVLTTNAWAGSASGLDKGADSFRDQGVALGSHSSEELQREFWEWRQQYPGQPYWVHFQTTDVHGPVLPQPPFAGLFAPIGTGERVQRERVVTDAWTQANLVRIRSGDASWLDRFEEMGVDRIAHFNGLRAVYDEALAHQDYQLGRFVERLKESGEWENTILVIAADHGFVGAVRDFLRLGRDVEAAEAPEVILRTSVSRVPLVFIWPGRIRGGQRIRHRVSMVDVLPTLLDLVGLPMPDILQGQSLAPLLLGQDGWESRPVIFDQFEGDASTGELSGQIEVIDGRWGASLWVGVPNANAPRRVPLLLYDIVDDPMALHPVNDEHPELVAHYTDFLTRQFEAHQLLAKRFTPGGDIELTAEQLETLRTLGYIR